MMCSLTDCKPPDNGTFLVDKSPSLTARLTKLAKHDYKDKISVNTAIQRPCQNKKILKVCGEEICHLNMILLHKSLCQRANVCTNL